MAKSRARATTTQSGALILVLGDQLSPQISSLRAGDRKRDRVLLVEVMEEATYVRHHKKKIAFLFSAMRHFAAELRDAGWAVDYRTIEETGPNSTFTSEVERAVGRHKPSKLVVTEPVNGASRRCFGPGKRGQGRFPCAVDVIDDDRFIASRAEFEAWARGRKQLRMEYFYREMRKKTGLLMHGDERSGANGTSITTTESPHAQISSCRNRCG